MTKSVCATCAKPPREAALAERGHNRHDATKRHANRKRRMHRAAGQLRFEGLEPPN